MEAPRDHIYRAKVDSSGRIAIPALARSRLGIREGDELVLVEQEDGLQVRTIDQAIRAAQELFARYIPPDVSLVEELHNERRAEAARE